MADRKWKYVAGGASEGAVDCSGAFTYWYKKAGSFMYHGSNTMWREYTVAKGKIGEMELIPGMAVFKHRDWTDAQNTNKWYKTEPGDVYHVGLYIGNGKVVEAKGTKYGVVYSSIDEWKLCARLKNTEFDIGNEDSISYPAMGIVATKSGVLNVRREPNTKATILTTLPKGSAVTVTGSNDGWYQVSVGEKTGYVSADYVEIRESISVHILRATISGNDTLSEVKKYLDEKMIPYTVEG